MKNKKYVFIILVILVIVSVLAISYALFSYSSNNNNDSVLTTGTLKLNLEEKNTLSLLSTYPLSDTLAVTKEGYKFELENTGTEKSNFRLYIIDDEDSYTTNNVSESNKLDWTKIRYAVYKNDEQQIISNLNSDGVLYTGSIDSGITDKYELKVWLSSDATNSDAGKSFYGKLRIKAILSNRTNYDTGA